MFIPLLRPTKSMSITIEFASGCLPASSCAHKGERPKCPKNCGFLMWGHGWVRRYFDKFPQGTLIQRFLCPRCRVVITPRPSGYFSRIQTSIRSIFQVLKHRLQKMGWPNGVPRQRAGHWLRRFLEMCRFHFPQEEPLERLTRQYHRGAPFF